MKSRIQRESCIINCSLQENGPDGGSKAVGWKELHVSFDFSVAVIRRNLGDAINLIMQVGTTSRNRP